MMTKELAIQRLDRLMDVVKPEIAEAIEWLIEESTVNLQPTCNQLATDCISRQAGIKELLSLNDQCNSVYYTKCIDDAVYALEILPSAQPEPQWIPVKFRPMDEEERTYWSDHYGYDIEYEDAVIFDCPMPEDGQEILVSYRKWISMDKCEIDGGCYGLEGNGDWEDVVAWMPLPEPWKGEDNG